MMFKERILMTLTIKPESLMTKFLKLIKDYDFKILDLNEEDRVVKFLVNLRMYPIVPMVIREYYSTAEYYVYAKARHNHSAAKLKEIFKKLKKNNNVKCWLITPMFSYTRILGLIITRYNKVILEIYPLRSGTKGSMFLKYVGNKIGNNVQDPQLLTSALPTFMYINEEIFYEIVGNASKALSYSEKILKKIFSETQTRK